jgi:Na+-translocating ferredoxin:NAD+ oxidoreductase subunit G
MKELLKLSIILTVICCGAALALGCVYELTKKPIARQQQLKKQRAVATVFPGLPLGNGTEGDVAQLCEDDHPDFCRDFFLLTTDRHVSGIALETSVSGYGGPIDVMVGLLPDGTLSAITIISHSETPGLGANITKESFCGQFSGLAGSESGLELKKNGGTIDHVTGATISSAAVLRAVQEQVGFFNANRSQIMNARAEAHRGP